MKTIKTMGSKFFTLLILLAQYVTPSDYQIRPLDRTNQEEISQVIALCTSQMLMNANKYDAQTLQKEVEDSSYIITIAQDTHNNIQGALFAFIPKSSLWVVTLAAQPTNQNTSSDLLQSLERVPNISAIIINVYASNSAIYNILQKLGYTQTDCFITLQKKVAPTTHCSPFLSPVTVQPLNQDNEEHVLSFCNLFNKDEIDFYGPEEIHHAIKKNSYKFLCALDSSGTICGGLAYSALPDNWYLDMIAVHKNHRKQGIATQILCEVEQMAILNNIAHLSLTVRPTNTAAYSCYTHYGFEQVDQICQMTKSLKS